MNKAIPIKVRTSSLILNYRTSKITLGPVLSLFLPYMYIAHGYNIHIIASNVDIHCQF
jgi:hypothetical protein